jgi:hypothetical protein
MATKKPAMKRANSAYAKLERQEKKLDMQEDKIEAKKKALKAADMENTIRRAVRAEMTRKPAKSR